MSLKETIKELQIESMKNGNKLNLSVAKELMTKVLVKEKSAANVVLTDQDIVQLVKKSLNEHKETLSFLEPIGKPDPIAYEKTFISALESFLPKEKSREEALAILSAYISENNLSGKQSFGSVMKFVGTVPDIDKKLASGILNEILK